MSRKREKRAVRRRMAERGETYEEALAAVRAPMPTFVPSPPPEEVMVDDPLAGLPEWAEEEE